MKVDVKQRISAYRHTGVTGEVELTPFDKRMTAIVGATPKHARLI